MPVDNSSRRAFLRGSLLTRAGREADVRSRSPLGPAPPWHHDVALEFYCHECAQPCADACEQSIIAFHPAGHRLGHTPYLDFSDAGCTYCGSCAEACPAIEDHHEDLPPRQGLASIDRPRCMAWNDVICMSCRNCCVNNAILLSDYRRARIVEDRCTGCGQCVHTCPLDAISIEL